MKIHNPNDYENYLPIGDKVLLVLPRIEPDALVDVGGILVDKNASLKNTPIRESMVIAAGPDSKQAHKGDTVLWNINNASPFPFGENDLYFLPEAHLICITKKAAPAGNGFPYPVDGAPGPGGFKL